MLVRLPYSYLFGASSLRYGAINGFLVAVVPFTERGLLHDGHHLLNFNLVVVLLVIYRRWLCVSVVFAHRSGIGLRHLVACRES